MKIQKSQKNNCAHHEVLLSAHYPPNLSCPLYILLSCAHQIASPSRRLALGNPLCGRHLHLHPHNLKYPLVLARRSPGTAYRILHDDYSSNVLKIARRLFTCGYQRKRGHGGGGCFGYNNFVSLFKYIFVSIPSPKINADTISLISKSLILLFVS